MIEQLFDDDIVTEEVEFDAPLDELHPLEAARLGSVVRKRYVEYRAGRHCARRALACLGIVDYPLLAGEDRAPIWPAGIVGSLTHTGTATAGKSAAVVARAESIRSLGLDLEDDSPLEPELVPRIATPAELTWLDGLASDVRLRAGKLLFCAKEAFYKCQYPLTREFLGFHDAEVRVTLETGRVEVRFLKASGEFPAGFSIAGRLGWDAGFLRVGMTLR